MLVPFPQGSLKSAVWIDLSEATEAEVAQVTAATGLKVPSEHDINEIEATSRLTFDKGAYTLTTPLVDAGDTESHALTAVGFVLSAKVLLTIRFTHVPAIETARDQCGARQAQTAEDVFLSIIERIVDRSADELERAGAACDDLSLRAFHSNNKHRTKTSQVLSAALRRVGAEAGHTSRLRDTLLGIGRISAYVMESGLEGAPPVNAARLKAIRADVASLTDYQSHLSNKIQFLLDATLGFISIEQNEIVKTLTIASVVGIPPVLIAGIYGMNFKVMPELGWQFGYPYALALIVVSALIPLVWFKLRGWL